MYGCLDFFHWLVVAVSKAILLVSIEPQNGGNSIGSVSVLNVIPIVTVLGLASALGLIFAKKTGDARNVAPA